MTTLKIKELHCNSCISNIRESIQEKDQAAEVTGDIENSEINVSSKLDENQLKEIVSNAGYKLLE